MDKFDRIQKLHRILSTRRTPISLDDLAHQLECDRKTVRRAIDTLESYVFAPIVYDETLKGWRYDRSSADRFELSGLWLTSEELHGLAIIMQLTQSMDSGLLGEDFKLVERSVEKLLKARKVQPELFKEKVEYLPKHRRQAPSQTFRKLGAALL
jgi:predicted DNA-binding transcriptional regulator YafY